MSGTAQTNANPAAVPWPGRTAVTLATLAALLMLPLPPLLVLPLPAAPPQAPSREQALRALRRAVEFYRARAAVHGGYHFAYTDDFSYARSEHGEGFTQAEVQREGTLIVGMTYLDAYAATADRYYLEAARETAQALVRGQLCSGGWDYTIEFDPEKRKQYPYRVDGCPPETPPGPGRASRAPQRHMTTLDDNVTQAAVRLLMRVDRELDFQDKPIHEAALFALDSLLGAQYPNGAWPQRYARFPEPSPDAAHFPVQRAGYPDSWPRTWPGEDYRAHYTFNDNCVVDAIDVMLEAARIYGQPRYRAAAEQGGEFILMAQMPDPQPGWAQQYDRNMHPAWARRFEPPSITGGEAQSVMQMLLVLYRETGNRKYLEPLPRALAYYRRSALPDADRPSEMRARACPPGTLCLARFYELKTNRPLYITKGTRVTVRSQPAAILDGYELSYSDASVITHYGVLVNGNQLLAISDEYQRLSKADPATIRRPSKLSGLSPWSGGWEPVGAGSGQRLPGGADVSPASAAGTPPQPTGGLRSQGMAQGSRGSDLAARAQTIIAAQDQRGAWVEEGSIGADNRILSLFAANGMVLAVGDRTVPLKENDTVQVFAGQRPPRQRIIRSRTFAKNVAALCAFLAAARN